MKVLTSLAEYAKNALYIIAFITAVSGFLTYIWNAITAPPFDYIYTVVKKSNPVSKNVGQLESTFNTFLADKVKEAKLTQKDIKGANEFMTEWRKLLQLKGPGSIFCTS
jgi:hypothetical protein